MKRIQIVLPFLFCSYSANIFASTQSFLTQDFTRRKAYISTMTQDQIKKLRDDLKLKANNVKLSPRERWMAVTSFAAMPGDESLANLKSLAESPDWLVRNASLVATHQISSSEGRTLAIQQLSDPALVVRASALDILAQSIDSEDVRSQFWSFISDRKNFRRNQSLFVRSNALKALAKSPMKNEFRSFLELLDDKDPQMAGIAIQGLEKLTNRSFVSKGESLEAQKQKWKLFAKNPSDQKF